MKTISISGRELTLHCNMRALVTYQRIVGVNPLDIQHHTDEQAAMYDLTLGWCMLSAEDQNRIGIEELANSIDTLDEQVAFSKAVSDEINRFMGVKPGDADTADRHEPQGEMDGEADKFEKNA